MPQQDNPATAPPDGPRVLVWPSCWYPNRNAPGSGVFVRRQAAAVAPFCPTAVLFVAADPHLRKGNGLEFAIEEGVPTARAYYRPAPLSPWRAAVDAIRFMRAAAAGRRILPAPFRDPDLIHVHVTPAAGLILFLRLHWRRKPVVFSEHWSHYLLAEKRERGLRARLLRGFASRCSAVTAVSEMLAEGMRESGWRARRWRVIGNPIDPAIFHPSPEKRAADGGEALILHVSNFAAVKNAAGIVRAMAQLARRGVRARLLMIGEGGTRRSCEETARDLGLHGGAVCFAGPLPADELAAVMRRADILVLFSAAETFACVAAEALASGLAVVSTPTAVAEYLPDGSGALVPFGDENALAAALERLVERRRGFDGAPGRRAVSERFAPAEVGRRFQELYREVLEENGP